MKDTLSHLFGSPLRLKLVRLFIFNPLVQFDVDIIAAKFGAKQSDVEKEATALTKIGLAKAGKVSKIVEKKKGKKIVTKKVRIPTWALAP